MVFGPASTENNLYKNMRESVKVSNMAEYLCLGSSVWTHEKVYNIQYIHTYAHSPRRLKDFMHGLINYTDTKAFVGFS